MANKQLFIIVDGDPSHGAHTTMTSSLHALPNYGLLAQVLGKLPNGKPAEAFVVLQPPNSPQLNLAEYYNRQLRMSVNRIQRSKDVLAAKFATIFRGQVLEHRLGVLKECLEACLEHMKTEPAHNNSFNTLISFFKQVVADRGYLNYSQKM